MFRETRCYIGIFRFKLQRQNFETEQLNVCGFGCCMCPDYILTSYRNVKDRLWLPCCIDRKITKGRTVIHY
jgi:hypothetical protein